MPLHNEHPIRPTPPTALSVQNSVLPLTALEEAAHLELSALHGRRIVGTGSYGPHRRGGPCAGDEPVTPRRSPQGIQMLFDFTYEIVRDGASHRGFTLYNHVAEADSQPQFPTDMKCDLTQVATIVTTTDGLAPRVSWADDAFGPQGDLGC